jgi:hypothetical protein
VAGPARERLRAKSGKFEGKTTEEVLLKYPDWARAVTHKYPDAKHSMEFRSLANKFDAKPFTKPCEGCRKEVTRATAYRGSSHLEFWCNDCDPTQTGAQRSKLTFVKTLGEVIRQMRR